MARKKDFLKSDPMADMEAQIETANRQKDKITRDLRKRKAESPME